ncbi:MAG: hypothetical protein WDO70_01150 [Alphaproteobacteria bacterium]
MANKKLYAAVIAGFIAAKCAYRPAAEAALGLVPLQVTYHPGGKVDPDGAITISRQWRTETGGHAEGHGYRIPSVPLLPKLDLL